MALRIDTWDRMPRRFPLGHILGNVLLDILDRSKDIPEDAENTLSEGDQDQRFGRRSLRRLGARLLPWVVGHQLENPHMDSG